MQLHKPVGQSETTAAPDFPKKISSRETNFRKAPKNGNENVGFQEIKITHGVMRRTLPPARATIAASALSGSCAL